MYFGYWENSRKLVKSLNCANATVERDTEKHLYLTSLDNF